MPRACRNCLKSLMARCFLLALSMNNACRFPHEVVVKVGKTIALTLIFAISIGSACTVLLSREISYCTASSRSWTMNEYHIFQDIIPSVLFSDGGFCCSSKNSVKKVHTQVDPTLEATNPSSENCLNKSRGSLYFMKLQFHSIYNVRVYAFQSHAKWNRRGWYICYESKFPTCITAQFPRKLQVPKRAQHCLKQLDVVPFLPIIYPTIDIIN